MSLTIPTALSRNVIDAWADEGRRWLEGLPDLLADLAHDWELVLGEPYGLSYHWVTPVTRADGTAAVLKVGLPLPHLSQQAEALRIADGQGAVRLLAEDIARGAMLLERAEPGDLVASLVPDRDEEATAVLIAAARALHRPPPPGCTLPNLRDEGRSFPGYLDRFPASTGPLPRHLVEAAAALFEDLCASATETVVLHGDLHHDNVLRAQREPWLAIDPFGLVGDPGFDSSTMLYNPDPDRRDDALLALVPARVEQLADGLGLPIERVVAWGFVMAVLAEVWTSEGDGTPGNRALDVATLLYPQL